MTSRYDFRDGFGEWGRSAFRLAAAAVLAGSVGACSLTLSSMDEEADEPVATGSLKPAALSPLSPELGVEDWRRAKAAIAVALDPQGNGASTDWSNPDTGLKGTITPLDKPFVKASDICRRFSATTRGAATATRVTATGCRVEAAEWTLSDVKVITD